MQYTDYQKARDASWYILIDQKICRLPIKITEICRSLGIDVLAYADGQQAIAGLKMTKHASQTDGFTIIIKQQPVIFFDDTLIPTRCRFTIAHELGHVLLGHLKQGRPTVINREPDAGDNPEETAANIFAARLLAPACVIWALKLHTADEIAATCQISHQAAAFRAERMRLLYEREQTFLRERGKSCFLQSPIEREVFRQFQSYIENHKSR